MVNCIRKIIVRYKGVLLYLFFGVLTTAVNYAIYYPLYNFAGISASLSNIAAWCAAVAFAFITNKPIVFSSRDWSVKTVITELVRFISCRLASGVAETLIICLAVDLAKWNGNIIKVIVSILVVIMNYFASKFIVFKKTQSN